MIFLTRTMYGRKNEVDVRGGEASQPCRSERHSGTCQTCTYHGDHGATPNLAFPTPGSKNTSLFRFMLCQDAILIQGVRFQDLTN